MKKTDLTGRRFGRLTVLREHPEPYRSPSGTVTRRWVCVCDCGREIIVLRNALTGKNGTRSCGCVRREASQKPLPASGERFGRLVVVGWCTRLRPVDNDCRAIVCQCDCGRTAVVSRKALMNDGTRSCGCLLSDTARDKIHAGTLTHVDGTQLSAIRPDRPPNKNSKSGIKGVYYSKGEQRWIAKIGVKGKNITIGRFHTKEEAVEARAKAEEKYYKPVLDKHKQ